MVFSVIVTINIKKNYYNLNYKIIIELRRSIVGNAGVFRGKNSLC